jgi:2-methylcitrate dehydratase PrpD
LTSADIAAIHIGTYAKGVEICGNPDPETVYEAKFSLAYVVAAALVTGRVRFAAFTNEQLADSEIRAVMGRVTSSIDVAAEAVFPNRRSATLQVETTDGRRLSHHSPTRKGDPDCPLSDAELEDKYRELVEPVIGEETTATLLATCWRLEDFGDVRALPYTPAGKAARSA